MLFERTLNLRYHTQDRGDSCGSAVATMVLRHFGVPHAQLEQSVLHGLLSQHAVLPGVVTSPQALRHLLVQRAGAGHFSGTQSSSVQDLAHRIVTSIVSHGLPAAATFFRNCHWVLIDGIQTDVEPVAGEPYTLRGVWIHNPVPNGAGPPPPHCETDECGIGLSRRGVAKEFLTAQQWALDAEATRALGIPDLTLASVAPAPLNHIGPPLLKPPAASPQPLSPTQAVEVARETLVEYDLRRHLPANNLEPGDPILINLIDGQNTAYYVVPWRDQRGYLAFSRIDQKGGWLKSVGFTGQPVDRYVRTRQEVVSVLSRYLAAQFGLHELQGVTGEPTMQALRRWLRQKVNASRLVWRPSLESLSPYFPFHEISLEPFPRAYVDQEDDVHWELSDPLPGG